MGSRCGGPVDQGKRGDGRRCRGQPVYVQSIDATDSRGDCGRRNSGRGLASALANPCRPRSNEHDHIMKPSLRIALLGTGLLGRAIAERLQAVGHTVIVYNRTAAKALPLQAQGIAVAGTPELAVAQAEYVLLLLTDAAAIRSVLLSPACAAALKGKTIVQMGTIGSRESLDLQQEIERYG